MTKSQNGSSIEEQNKISESCKNIELPESCDKLLAVVIDLAQLPFIHNFLRVVVTVKALQVPEAMTVTGGKQKQEVVVGDHTAPARVTLWEQHVEALQEGSFYSLKNLIVWEYGIVKYLSMPWEGYEIVPIDDIGDIVLSTCDVTEHLKTELLDPVISAVSSLDSYKACIWSKAMVELQYPPLGRCSKDDCSMMQRYDLWKDQHLQRC